MVIYLQTQTNMYEVVMEMNSRQLLVESRVDGIEDTLRSLKVTKFIVAILVTRVTKFHLMKDYYL